MKNLVGAILDCASDRSDWNGALDEFATTFGARSAVLQGDDSEHIRRELLGMGRFFRETARDLPKTYENREDEGDEAVYRALAVAEPGKLIAEHELFGVESRADLPPSGFRQMLIDRGLACRSGAVLNHIGPTMDVFGVFFESEGAEQRALNDPNLPFAVQLMARSVALKRVMTSLRVRYEAALTALDHLGLGVFLVDETAAVLLSNREGQRIAEESNGALCLTRSRRLCSYDPDAEQALRAKISNVAKTARGEGRAGGESFSMPRPGDAFDLLVSVTPLADAAMELEAGLRCAFLMVIDPEKRGALDTSGLALLGGLTEAESEVTAGLVDGLRVNEIAEQRNTSPHTVRGQIKTITSKLRCRSQADIIRLAAATRLPFADDG